MNDFDVFATLLMVLKRPHVDIIRINFVTADSALIDCVHKELEPELEDPYELISYGSPRLCFVGTFDVAPPEAAYMEVKVASPSKDAE